MQNKLNQFIKIEAYDYYNNKIDEYDGYFVNVTSQPGMQLNHVRGVKYLLISFN